MEQSSGHVCRLVVVGSWSGRATGRSSSRLTVEALQDVMNGGELAPGALLQFAMPALHADGSR
jgi:hypothetical protein